MSARQVLRNRIQIRNHRLVFFDDQHLVIRLNFFFFRRHVHSRRLSPPQSRIKWSQAPRTPTLSLECVGELCQAEQREPENDVEPQLPPKSAAFSI